jgi:ABC-type antimicrobial peptide transport system permease subunit
MRMIDRLSPQYRPWRLGAALFGIFGILALLVAALGIYSSVSYFVTRRVGELGVRLALGATTVELMRHVVDRGVRPVAAGAAVGAGLAIISSRLISSLLYGMNTWNPVVIAAVVFMLVSVGVIASCIPAWRAAHIDPVSAITAG